MFGGQAVFEELHMPEVPDFPQMEKLDMERQAVGFYLSAHPLDAYEDNFERLRVNLTTEIEPLVRSAGSARVRIACIINEKRERISQKSGKKFAFITGSDTVGTFEALCFSEVLNQSREMLDSGKPLIVSLSADLNEEGAVRANVQNVEYLTDAVARVSETIVLYINSPACLPAIKEVLAKENSGRGSVIIVAQAQGYQVEIKLADGYSLSASATTALRAIPGIYQVKQF